MKSFITILLICFCAISNGQKYNFKRFSVEEGLSQPGLFCLQEDYHGNLWVGLDNGGVQVFDGWKFKTIDNRITGKNIRALFNSSEGDMWIGSSTDGITVLGSDTIHLGHEQGLVSNHVRSFCEDIKGKIWVSTIGGGVVVFEDKTVFKSYEYDNGLPSLNSRAVLSAHNGNVWVGTDRGLVVFKDYQVVTTYSKKKGLLGNKILALTQDHEGNVWVGTEKGLNMIATDTILSFDREFGLKGKRVKSLLVDAKNKIWIGTRNGLGCLSFNGFNSSTKTHATSNYKLQWYQEENGLSNDRIRCLYEDRSKALWIGTYFGGLSKFFNNSFKLYTKEDGITTNAVNTVQYHPADSALWVGTHGGGLKVFADTEWDLTADKGLSNNTITCFKLYKTGEALVGTEEGLNLIIDKQVVRVWDDYDSFFEGKKITHLAATDSHALLLTDKHKLIALKTISGFSYDEQITKKLVELLGQDVFAVSKAGNQFWVSNNDHLHSFKISQNEIQDFRSWEIKNSDGIAGNKKTKLGYTSDDHLYVIRDGRVEWFDTLHKYHDIKFLIEGTLNDKVSSFWIGVNKGVVNITMQGVKILSRKKYTIDEGFMGVQSFKNSAGKNFDGSIYIGTVKGLLKIEPEAYQGVKRNLKVSLQGMLFEGDQVDLSPFTTGSKDGIPIGLQLPYNMDNITFQVSAIHLKNPKEVKYKYMLKGWDKEFRIKTAQESKGEGNIFHVDYDHIAAGHYEFIAYAKTPCGEWSKNPLVVSLEITPVWWKNAIYITTVVLLSIGLLVFVIISRTRRLIREKEKLEELVVHRTKDLHSEKQKSDDLLLNILPVEIAAELKQFGSAKTKSHVSASVLFTDFEGFTHLSMELTAEELVQRLDEIFVEFDDVIERNRLEKIKTIGDAYMCASGVPESNPHQEINIVIAGLQLLEVMNRFNQKQVASNKPEWNVRVGIHTGELIAGVVGKKKFAYDVWGDTVNIASRMESSGEVGKVNVSESTYEIVKSYFDFEKRGKVAAKNKGELDMYFISGIKEDYQKDNLFTPSEKLYL